MKNLFIVANWKSNKSTSEAKEWLQEISNFSPRGTPRVDAGEAGKFQIFNNKEVIVCPSFTLFPTMHYFIKKDIIAIELGAQDISPFGQGAYTGEVSAKQIKEYVGYVLIGHSERRKYFHEDEEMIGKKVQMALQNNIVPILCVQDATGNIPQGVTMAAYEPIFAIGTGNPDSPLNANEMAKKLKAKGIQTVIYGGSVTSENVHSFTKMSDIDGVLLGGASLHVKEFTQIIHNA